MDTVDVPSFVEQDDIVRNLDNDPLLTTFFTSFVTADGFLRELDPPEINRVFFVPDPDPITGQIPGNGILAFEFSEAMDPAAFVVGEALTFQEYARRVASWLTRSPPSQGNDCDSASGR